MRGLILHRAIIWHPTDGNISNPRKTLERLLSGQADASLAFADVVRLLDKLGFSSRTKGGHHIFHQTGIEEILNPQPKGSQAKPYQVRQVRDVILKCKRSLDKNA